MSTKLQIKGKKEQIDLARGSSTPKEGDILHLILKGEKKERTYIVYTIEHTIDFNSMLPISQTVVTVEEVKAKKKIIPVEPTLFKTGV